MLGSRVDIVTLGLAVMNAKNTAIFTVMVIWLMQNVTERNTNSNELLNHWKSARHLLLQGRVHIIVISFFKVIFHILLYICVIIYHFILYHIQLFLHWASFLNLYKSYIYGLV